MLISGVSDENEDSHRGQELEEAAGHHEEYKTASELFDLMTRDRQFNTDGKSGNQHYQSFYIEISTYISCYISFFGTVENVTVGSIHNTFKYEAVI